MKSTNPATSEEFVKDNTNRAGGMKILHVISNMDPKMGGVCQAVRSMAAGLISVGISSEVVSLDSPDAAFVNEGELVIHAVGPSKGPWVHAPKLVPWLVKHAPQFDIVIIHGLWLYHVYATRKATNILQRERSRIPQIFIMPHGMLDPYFQREPGRKLKALRNVLYWKFVESQTVQMADGLLFTCEEERQLARDTFRPYNPKTQKVVGLGVEQPPVYTSEMQLAFHKHCPEIANTPYFLFLSRIHQKKGTDILIEAYSEIKKEQPDIPKLVIAGPDIESAFGQEIKKMVETKQLQDDVFFPGMISGLAKWGAFYGSECFILPSHQENFGIAVVEALACAAPVLISDKINIWREIKAGEGGIIADDTVAGTKRLFQQWLRHSEAEKQRMKTKAVSTYQAYFAPESISIKMQQFFNKSMGHDLTIQ